jgi:hypothetical protein
MTAWGLTGGRRKAVLAVVSGACMALSACAAASTGDTPGEPQRAAIPPATLKFCEHIATAMKSLDGKSITPDMTLKQAHTLVDQLMTSGAAAFTTLAGQAPADMRSTVRGVVSDFQAYQRSVDKTKTVHAILQMVAQGTPSQQPSYAKLLTFTSNNC